MDTLSAYSIPIQGLKEGIHRFEYQIDKTFFTHFKESPIEDGRFDLIVYFDKRPNLIVLTFEFEGTMKTVCDRCLVAIELPLNNSQQLLVKYAEEKSEEADIIYIHRGDFELNLAKYIYEYICLSIPMIKAYNCKEDENVVCNKEMLRYLENRNEKKQKKEEQQNPIWEQLQNFDNS